MSNNFNQYKLKLISEKTREEFVSDYPLIDYLCENKQVTHIFIKGQRGIGKSYQIQNAFNTLQEKKIIDCVFYELNYPEFEKYIESFGFVTAYGSFTDIVVLCPAWKVAGVNLSTGYYNEHNFIEYLRPNQLMATIDKVEKMLRAEDNVHWKYIPYKKGSNSPWNIACGMGPLEDDTEIVTCAGCGKEFFEIETYPVNNFDIGEEQHFCIDCLCQNAHWCNCCAEPYIASNDYNHVNICPACYAAEREEENGSERNSSKGQNNQKDS